MTRLPGLVTALLLSLLLALIGTQVQAAPEFPKLTGRVVDAANVIPDDEEARLTQKLAALEQQSRRQLVIVTIPSLQGYEISDYGYQLGRAWGIGSKQRNDGALLIVAPNEKKLRVEVGYGLEPVLTDGYSSDVINNVIVPRFKAGDLAGGIEAGTDAIIQQLTLPAEEAQKIAAEADAARSDSGGGFGGAIFVLFVLFFFVLPVLRGMFGGGRRYRGSGLGGAVGNVILWDTLGRMGSGRSSDWGGGGSGWGGGGFSGGGGSFGGGGSSGSW